MDMPDKKVYKYILTVDIGIKNLAYCLARYTDITNNDLDILYWDILDISDKPLLCGQQDKKKICNKKSTYYTLIKSDNVKGNKNCKLSELHNDINNLRGVCAKHSAEIKKTDEKLYRITNNKLLDCGFNIMIDRLCNVLETFFKKISMTYNVIEGENGFTSENIINLDIYIENQPVTMNPVMKSIGIAVLTFFVLKKNEKNSIIRSVQFINPSNKTKLDFVKKLNIILNTDVTIDKKTSKKYDFKKYGDRKLFSVNVTDDYLNILNNSIYNVLTPTYYYLSKKKDDYGDTFLYVLYIYTL